MLPTLSIAQKYTSFVNDKLTFAFLLGWTLSQYLIRGLLPAAQLEELHKKVTWDFKKVSIQDFGIKTDQNNEVASDHLYTL